MKPDFEKAAKEKYPDYEHEESDAYSVDAFLAGCEHAYSIDKETIERLEKENAELKTKIEDLKTFAHEGLPDDCVLEYGEVKFCPNRLGVGNVCKWCSEFK